MTVMHDHYQRRLVAELRERAKTFDCYYCRYAIERHADLLEIALKAVHKEGEHGRGETKSRVPDGSA